MGRRILELLWWIFRAVILGLCVGAAMWAVNTGIGAITQIRETHTYLVAALPLGAFLIAWAYQELGPVLRSGTAMVIQMINYGIFGDTYKHSFKSISVKMAPLVYVSALLSHLVGASVGKEGAGVQIGASIGDYLRHIENLILPKRWNLHDPTRDGIWLIMGAGAAFGSLFNAPIAGMLFGLQFSAPGVNRTDAYIPCAVSSYSAVLFSHNVLHTPTLIPHIAEHIDLSAMVLVELSLIAIIMGLYCKLFLFLAMKWKDWLKEHVGGVYKSAVLSALLVLSISLACYTLFGGFPLNGLSSSLIGVQVAWYVPLLKMLLTVLSLGAGFVGGEVVPVLVLGSTLGSFFSPLFSLPLGATVSFACMGMLSAATKLPFVCAILGLELFGFANPSLLFFVCIISYAVSGTLGIYAKQQPTIALGGRWR